MSTQPDRSPEERTEKPAEAITFPARVDRVERAWSSVDSDMPLVIKLARAGLRLPALSAELDDTRAQLAKVREQRDNARSADLRGRVEREELRAALAERDATIAEKAVAAIKAVPRRSGTPEWSSHRAVAQAAGFDMGLAYAADAVRAALGGEPETVEPDERAQVAAWFGTYPDGVMATSRGRVRSLAEYDLLACSTCTPEATT